MGIIQNKLTFTVFTLVVLFSIVGFAILLYLVTLAIGTCDHYLNSLVTLKIMNSL